MVSLRGLIEAKMNVGGMSDIAHGDGRDDGG